MYCCYTIILFIYLVLKTFCAALYITSAAFIVYYLHYLNHDNTNSTLGYFALNPALRQILLSKPDSQSEP